MTDTMSLVGASLHDEVLDMLDAIATNGDVDHGEYVTILASLRTQIDRTIADRTATSIALRLELSPSEAATLHHFIATHVPIHHGAFTRDSLLDIRKRLLHALKDSGVLS